MATTRRQFLQLSAAATVPYFVSSSYVRAGTFKSRPRLGLIGCGGKGHDDARQASEFGDFVAVCDVDRRHAESMTAYPPVAGDGKRRIDIYDDHRELLQRDDIDAVICATPDHWHTAIYVDALRAGKHVYGEKPMTLTIDEVKVLRLVAAKADAVFQVGNQQRSCQWFREAVAIAQSGVLGDNLTATCYLGRGKSGGPFPNKPVPDGLNWDQWLGQTPLVPYMPQRCHGSFRWWYEYSGGKLTDWGAHHIDIAQWALGMLDTGPLSIVGRGVHDSRPDCFNTAQTFAGTMRFANGNVLAFEDGGSKTNGIKIEGDKERIFVNRGKLVGNLINKISSDRKWHAQIRAAAAALYDGPYGFPEIALKNYNRFGGSGDAGWVRVKRSHMGNFFNCIEQGTRPISDVVSVGQATISCHLANIALRLGDPLSWDPRAERFLNNDRANAMLARPQRAPYKITAA